MARIKLTTISLAVVAALTFGQTARADDLGYQAIQNHDWATAERELLAGLQQDPGNLSRQLNLAWVYAQTGRKEQAAALYREILKRDQDRFASSPFRNTESMAALAERGLSRLK